MEMLLSWLILAAAVWIAAVVLPGMKVRGGASVLLVAAIFGVLNFFLGWLLFVVIGIGTLGLGFLLAFLTRLVVDAVLLKLIDGLTTRLSIRGFGTALLAALIMAGVGTAGEYVLNTVF